MAPEPARFPWLEPRGDGLCRVHVLFTRELCPGDPKSVLQHVLEGEPDILQLREKDVTASAFLDWASFVREELSQSSTALIVNDRVDLALASEADGVHLGQDDVPVALARSLAAERPFAIGLSTHDREQAEEASRNLDVDYVGIGPLFPTKTKGYEKGIGPEVALEMQRAARRPAFWIGGIDLSNAARLRGAFGIACSTAILRASEPGRAIRELRSRVPRAE